MTRTLRAANAALAVFDGELLDVIIQQNWQGQIAPAIAVLGDMAEDDADTYDVSARISWVGWVSTQHFAPEVRDFLVDLAVNREV